MAAAIGLCLAPVSAGAVTDAPSSATSTTPQVLLVGSFHGLKGTYRSIQAAVNAAEPGAYILVGPGDYHPADDHVHRPTAAQARNGDMGGVVITTPGITLRGMDRHSVIVDGTKPGAPKACDAQRKWQNFGPLGANKTHDGRNGIVIWKANGVTVDNMTICNFLGGSGDSGNELWWNGGANSGKIGLKGYWSSYVTATTSYFGGEATAARYGVFASNSAGPGSFDYSYANNFNDSGIYVGACKRACDMVIDHAWMENNALGYSGTNSGGSMLIENSQFDHNEDGFDTNTALSADPTAPQDGRCPGGKKSPITHTRSCWVFRNNYVHNNNNPSTPKAGSAAAGPTGTGMTVSGGRWDTIEHNRFVNNGAWGVLFVPYPDSGKPAVGQSCKKTGGFEMAPFGCVYDPEADALLGNTFVHDGYFHNPTNSDFGQITLAGHEPQNCFRNNVAPNGSAPKNLEATQHYCGPLTKAANPGGALLGQVLCDTGFGGCPAGAKYPVSNKVILTKVPKSLPTMPNPCAGVPSNPWCPGGKPLGAAPGSTGSGSTGSGSTGSGSTGSGAGSGGPRQPAGEHAVMLGWVSPGWRRAG